MSTDHTWPPGRVLVASDFHLGSGRDRVTETCVATENFLGDEVFAAWLAHHARDAPRTLLVLNGDIFDVLRVTEVPSAPKDFEDWSRRLRELGRELSAEELSASVQRSERRYGLKTHDFKTVWKLMLTAESHPPFFDALASWVGAGGRVAFTTGNHDVELHWPLVREAIRLELRHRGVPAGAGDERVTFVDAHLLLDNLWIEHGHQHEELTRVEGPPALPGGEEINLPLGSFVNRYFINRVEALDPFIDNVKPVQQSLLRLARQRPLKLATTYLGGWRFLRRALAKRRLNRSVALIGAALTLPFALPLLLLAVPPVRDWAFGGGPLADIVALVSGVVATGVLPYVLGAVSELRRRRPPKDHQLEAARHIVAHDFAGCARKKAYVCMGHTHMTAVKRIDPEGDRLLVNTGTWTALWPRDRPDLLGQTLYTYAVFDAIHDEGYRGAVMEWDDHAGRARRATILVAAA